MQFNQCLVKESKSLSSVFYLSFFLYSPNTVNLHYTLLAHIHLAAYQDPQIPLIRAAFQSVLLQGAVPLQVKENSAFIHLDVLQSPATHSSSAYSGLSDWQYYPWISISFMCLRTWQESTVLPQDTEQYRSQDTSLQVLACHHFPGSVQLTNHYSLSPIIQCFLFLNPPGCPSSQVTTATTRLGQDIMDTYALN